MKKVQVDTTKQWEKVFKAFKHLFNLAKNPISEEEAIKKDFSFISDDLTFMCITKTEDARRCLRIFAEAENKEAIPSLDYYGNTHIENTSSYSLERLIPLLKCFVHLGESAKFSLNGNYPLKIEGTDFIFILAPRMRFD